MMMLSAFAATSALAMEYDSAADDAPKAEANFAQYAMYTRRGAGLRQGGGGRGRGRSHSKKGTVSPLRANTGGALEGGAGIPVEHAPIRSAAAEAAPEGGDGGPQGRRRQTGAQQPSTGFSLRETWGAGCKTLAAVGEFLGGLL